MASSQNSTREYPYGKYPQNKYERNRTFSSNTNDYYRNKLSRLGIDKDLRELLERKKLQKDQEKNLTTTCSDDNALKVEKKVRFEGEPLLRRAKSFSDSTTRPEHYQRHRPSFDMFSKEHNVAMPHHLHQKHRIKKTNFVDLYHPTNIKIELHTDTGARKYTVDSTVPIPDIKCNLKKSRTLSKHSEPKENSSLLQDNRNEIKTDRIRGSGHFRGTTRRSFNKKNRENKEHKSSQNNECDNDLAVSNVVETLTTLDIKDETEK